jgi:hypothetical protein
MLSSPVCDLAPELQTSEIAEGFMKHPVYRAYVCVCVCGEGDNFYDPTQG